MKDKFKSLAKYIPFSMQVAGISLLYLHTDHITMVAVWLLVVGYNWKLRSKVASAIMELIKNYKKLSENILVLFNHLKNEQ